MLLQLLLVLLASSLVKSLAINVNIFKDEITNEVSPTTCDVNACDAICKKFGYKDGICSDGQCKCSYYVRSNHLTKEVRSQDDCDDSTCNAWCISYGYPGGICAGGSCYCYNFKHLKDHLTKEVRSQDDCDDSTCNSWCISYGYPGGICAGGSCYCYNFKPLKEHLTNEVRSQNDCDDSTCNAWCIGSGSTGGICLVDYCYCYNFKPLKEFLRLTAHKENILHEDSVKHHTISKDNDEPEKPLPSDLKSCIDLCRESNYIKGMFIRHRCTCY